jgi:hypothetical protein
MSAHAYIQYADVPDELTASSRQNIDDVTQAKMVAFDGCPLVGQLDPVGDRMQVEYPFPRDANLRTQLVNWFFHWGIHFTVVM